MLIEGIDVDDRIIKFAKDMQIELNTNSKTKNDIFNWDISNNFPKWLYEFEYHKSKLIAALMAKDDDLKNEFCCDLANYVMYLYFCNPQQFNLQKSITLTESEIKII